MKKRIQSFGNIIIHFPVDPISLRGTFHASGLNNSDKEMELKS